jgi:2-polyprenyl-3-methyl-5-hydroxy-6-metoxy-1,4-benzoquinol methylase
MEQSRVLAPIDFWQQNYGDSPLLEAKADHPVIRWLAEHIPAGHGDCIEIGCFQGHFLPFFGHLGYRLHGLDVVSRVLDMPAWLHERGLAVGDFWQQDFFSFKPQRQYEIVCSFGFIEHFTAWEDVVARHIDLVAPGGLLVIMSPNFTGILQKYFHRFLDKENFLRHYLPAMDPHRWCKIAERQGFSPVFCGYFGRFDMWAAFQKRSLPAKLMVHGIVDILVPLLRRLPWPEGRKSYAPCCGMIAQKKPA